MPTLKGQLTFELTSRTKNISSSCYFSKCNISAPGTAPELKTLPVHSASPVTPAPTPVWTRRRQCPWSTIHQPFTDLWEVRYPEAGTAPRPTGQQNVMDTSGPPTSARAATDRLSLPDPAMSEVGGANPKDVVTTDFLLKTLKATDQIIKSFTSHLGALSNRVDNNTVKISEKASAICRQDEALANQHAEIRTIQDRVAALERGSAPATRLLIGRAILSPEYMLARKSIRLWPIPGHTEEDMRGDVGDFIHYTLRVPESEVGQENIVSVR